MTQAELKDKFFHEYLVWCSNAPEGDGSAMVMWLNCRYPTEDNFWEWMVHFKKVPKL
jgi:hypothetical protein